MYSPLIRYRNGRKRSTSNDWVTRPMTSRENWLFVGSDDGGSVNAIFMSLLASTHRCNVEPLSYLRDLIFDWPAHKLLELAH